MASPTPQWHARPFEQALEKSQALVDWVSTHQPRHWKAAQYWKQRNGATCTLYKSTLKVIFAEELYRDPDGFKARLRQAGYDQ